QTRRRVAIGSRRTMITWGGRRSVSSSGWKGWFTSPTTWTRCERSRDARRVGGVQRRPARARAVRAILSRRRGTPPERLSRWGGHARRARGSRNADRDSQALARSVGGGSRNDVTLSVHAVGGWLAIRRATRGGRLVRLARPAHRPRRARAPAIAVLRG